MTVMNSFFYESTSKKCTDYFYEAFNPLYTELIGLFLLTNYMVETIESLKNFYRICIREVIKFKFEFFLDCHMAASYFATKADFNFKTFLFLSEN